MKQNHISQGSPHPLPNDLQAPARESVTGSSQKPKPPPRSEGNSSRRRLGTTNGSNGCRSQVLHPILFTRCLWGRPTREKSRAALGGFSLIHPSRRRT